MKKILAIVVTMSMMLSVPAFADTNTTTQASVIEATTNVTSTTATADSGVKPDSALYGLDRLMEKIQISLITDSVQKAKLLASIAQERLAESAAMADKANVELAQKALGEYKVNLELAIKLIETAMEDGKEVADIMEGIKIENLKDAAVVAKILTTVPEEFRADVMLKIEQITKETEATNETAQVIENKEEQNSIKKEVTNRIIEENIKDAALIAKIKVAGLNTRQIVALISLSEQANKPLTEVIDLFLQNEKGIGATANKLGLNTKDALKGINASFKDIKETIKTAFKEAMKVVDEKDKAEVIALIDSNLNGQTVAPSATAEEVKIATEKLEKVVKEAKAQIKTIVAEKQGEKVLYKAEKSAEKLEKSVEKAIEKLEKSAEKAVKKLEKSAEKNDENDNDSDDDNDNNKDDDKDNQEKSKKSN